MKLRDISITSRHYSISERADLLDKSLLGRDLSWNEVEYMAKYFDVYNIQWSFN